MLLSDLKIEHDYGLLKNNNDLYNTNFSVSLHRYMGACVKDGHIHPVLEVTYYFLHNISCFAANQNDFQPTKQLQLLP